MSIAPEIIPSRRRGLLGRSTSSTAPPQSAKDFSVRPCAFNIAAMAKSTQSLVATEARSAGRFAISSSIVRMPRFPATATTRRSHEGKTASARIGCGRRNGPLPRKAIVTMIDGLIHATSNFPAPTRRAPARPLHHAGLTAKVKG
jgi:hypothetical protein